MLPLPALVADSAVDFVADPERTFSIVGIGASAGGEPRLKRFFPRSRGIGKSTWPLWWCSIWPRIIKVSSLN
jgi:hypothetical protein